MIFIMINEIIYNLEEPYIISNETSDFDLIFQQSGLAENLYESLQPKKQLFYSPDRPDLEKILSLIFINKNTHQIKLETIFDLNNIYENTSIGNEIICDKVLTEKQTKLCFKKEEFFIKEENHDKIFEIQVRLKNVGVSLIFNTGTIKTPYELAYFKIKCPEFCLIEEKQLRKVQLKFEDLQIENNNSSRINFPLVLLNNNKKNKAILNVNWEEKKIIEKKLLSLESFNLEVDDIVINLEKPFLTRCTEFYKEIKSILSRYKSSEAEQHHPLENMPFDAINAYDINYWQTISINLTEKNIYIKHLIIVPLYIKVSYKSAPESSSSSLKNWYKTFHNIDNAGFNLQGLEFHYYFDNKTALFTKIYINFKEKLYKNIFKAIGSIEILGNPVGLFNHFSVGVKDLLEKPLEGLANGPLEGGKGIVTGVSSFMRNTLTGTFNSVDKISSSFGIGLATLSSDDEYLKKIISRTDAAENVVDGLGQAGYSLFKGLENGVTGVFLKPYEGAKEEGVPGLLKGAVKGITGFFIKPITALFDATSKTAEGIKNTMNYEEVHQKLTRYKRPFYGIEKFYKEYSKEDAEIFEFLEKFKKGRYSKKTFYDFVTVHEDEKNDVKILVIMVESLLLLSLKKKRKEWEIETKNILRFDIFNDGIKILLKEKIKKIEVSRFLFI